MKMKELSAKKTTIMTTEEIYNFDIDTEDIKIF